MALVKYYIDADGRYLGGYPEGFQPENATEVAAPPPDFRMVRLDGLWKFSVETLAKQNEFHRANFETGGLTISEGVMISTSGSAQRKIHGAIEGLKLAPVGEKVDFAVTPTSSIQMDLAMMQEVFGAVFGHVQSAYSKQVEVYARIETGEITTFEQLELAWQ